MEDTQNGQEQFSNILKPGSGGLHTLVDPQDLEDTELSDVRNMLYNGGFLIPRQGFTQTFAKPSTETMLQNTLAVGQTSDGIDMMIAIYGTNYYLWDPLNLQTILLNKFSNVTYTDTPSTTGYQNFWSYVTWDNGVGADVMYFSNGVDATTKWQMSLQYAAAAQVAADKTIFFKFPNRVLASVQPTLIAMLAGVATKLTATSNSPTLTTYLGTSVTSFTLVSSNATNQTNNTNSTTYLWGENAVPSNNDTLIATINGTAVTITFVTAIGVTAGNVLIGSASVTMDNLLDLLLNPSVTNANHVAFSAGNQTLIGYSTYSKLDYGAVFFTGTIGAIIPVNTAITSAIGSTALVPVGGIISAFQRRLFSIGGKGTENNINWSQTSTPENFTTITSKVSDPGSTVWAQGTGGITGMVDGGGFMMFLKEFSLAQAQFLYSNDVATAYIFSLVEIATGRSIGTNSPKKIIKVGNNINYMTDIDGIIEMTTGTTSATGSSTGSSTASGAGTIGFTVLSEKINNLIQDNGIFFGNQGLSFYWNQKSFWCLSTTSTATNTIILVYDYLLGYWTIFDGWHVQDMNSYSNDLYFLSADDGSVNKCFQTYQDGTQAYTSYFYTKRFDFGQPALPKTLDKIFLQGYMDQGTTIQIDCIFDENTIPLATQKFVINGTDKVVLRPVGGGIGSGDIGSQIIGKILRAANSQLKLGVLRCYLDAAMKWGFYNLQLKISAKIIGSNFAIDKISFNPTMESYPPELAVASQ